jgi:hypothetical protein
LCPAIIAASHFADSEQLKFYFTSVTRVASSESPVTFRH